MKELIEYIARSIVDFPDQVLVTEERVGNQIVFHLQVAESDKGKVIGRQGRIINAIRTLLRVAAVREGARAILEVT